MISTKVLDRLIIGISMTFGLGITSMFMYGARQAGKVRYTDEEPQIFRVPLEYNISRYPINDAFIEPNGYSVRYKDPLTGQNLQILYEEDTPKPYSLPKTDQDERFKGFVHNPSTREHIKFFKDLSHNMQGYVDVIEYRFRLYLKDPGIFGGQQRLGGCRRNRDGLCKYVEIHMPQAEDFPIENNWDNVAQNPEYKKVYMARNF